MANNDTLPATGAIVEEIDIGGGVKRQVVTIGPRTGATTDSIALLALETGGNLGAIKTDTDTLAGAVSSSKMATKAASGDFADGSIATIGAKADAKSTATDTTAVSAMSVWKQISNSVQAVAASIAGTLTVATHAVTQSGSWVLSAGSAIIGKVGIDQTTPGTTNLVASGIADGSDITQGAKADAAWTSGSGSVIALLKAIAGGGGGGGGAVTVADGADVTQGAKADAAWTSGSGSAVALLKALAGKLDTLATDITNATGPVGAGTEAAAIRVTLSTDGTGVVVPVFHGIGPLSLQSNATGTTYNVFSSQACKQATLINDTGFDLELQLGATGTTFILWANSSLTIPGITNASTVGYRRKDQSNTQVTLAGFWNS